LASIRTIDFQQNGAGTQDFNIGSLNGRGLIFHDEATNTGTCTITMRTTDGTRSATALVYKPGNIGGGDGTNFGFPFQYDVLRIVWTGAGNHFGRIIVTDDPRPPWGKVPLFSRSTPIAASDEQDLLAQQNLGFIKAIALLVSANKAYTVRMTIRSGGVTSDPTVILSTAVATGAAQSFTMNGLYGEVQISMRNDDGAAALSPAVNAYGFLDLIAGTMTP
jgi:hypothetical protein